MLFLLPLYLKPMLAAGTDHGVLALGTGQTKHGTAGGAFIIDMCFPISEFVEAKSEEAAEFLVFSTSLLNVTGEHTEKNNHDQNGIHNGINKPKGQ